MLLVPFEDKLLVFSNKINNFFADRPNNFVTCSSATDNYKF